MKKLFILLSITLLAFHINAQSDTTEKIKRISWGVKYMSGVNYTGSEDRIISPAFMISVPVEYHFNHKWHLYVELRFGTRAFNTWVNDGYGGIYVYQNFRALELPVAIKRSFYSKHQKELFSVSAGGGLSVARGSQTVTPKWPGPGHQVFTVGLDGCEGTSSYFLINITKEFTYSKNKAVYIGLEYNSDLFNTNVINVTTEIITNTTYDIRNTRFTSHYNRITYFNVGLKF